jgi:hypothetical protein
MTRTIVPCAQSDFERIATIIRNTLDAPTFINPKSNCRRLTAALVLIEKIVTVQVLSNPPLEEKTDEVDARLTGPTLLRTYRVRTAKGGD